MSLILCAIFFISGTAALLFETLWFRQAGLSFGNSVWASSVVLASFMGGLALGNALAAGFGARLRRDPKGTICGSSRHCLRSTFGSMGRLRAHASCVSPETSLDARFQSRETYL